MENKAKVRWWNQQGLNIESEEMEIKEAELFAQWLEGCDSVWDIQIVETERISS